MACLKTCEEYIEQVISGKARSDPEVGRALNKCMSMFSHRELEVLEQMVKGNFEDLIMMNSLSKLQQTQIQIAEKLNNLFPLASRQFEQLRKESDKPI